MHFVIQYQKQANAQNLNCLYGVIPKMTLIFQKKVFKQVIPKNFEKTNPQAKFGVSIIFGVGFR